MIQDMKGKDEDALLSIIEHSLKQYRTNGSMSKLRAAVFIRSAAEELEALQLNNDELSQIDEGGNKQADLIVVKDFSSLPVEVDTIVEYEQEATLGDYDVLYQKWQWDGVSAESLIFKSVDVANLSDEQLQTEVRASPLVKKESRLTVKRTGEGYSFVNFNFVTS